MSNALINRGIGIVGVADNLKGKPIVIIGPPRGGTSMIAGALALLGVFMGDRAVKPVYEDERLSEAFELKDLNAVEIIAKEYSATHERWGWKRPSAINYLSDVNKCLHTPVYIFIYKDIFSIAQRNSISMLSDLLPAMQNALFEYKITLDFLKKESPRAMLISYDKAVNDPQFFIKTLIEFLELEPTLEQQQSAVSFVRPNPEDYLEESRITKAEGNLDAVKNKVISGWARYIHQKKAATVDIYLNGTKLGSVVANIQREDISKLFHQDCAFYYQIPDEIDLNVGDAISARVNNDVHDLKNSPLVII